MSRKKWWLVISVVSLIILLLTTWPDGKARVIFCDVGQGNGVLVLKKNFQMLIDVGPGSRKMLQCLSKFLPFWDKTIDAVIISHSDNDHSGGLGQIKEYYNVQNIYSGNLAENDMLRYEDITFEVLSSGGYGDQNDDSVIGLLKMGDRGFLLMGDVSGQVEQKLIWRKILTNKVGVLLVSHHGSAGATSQELLDIVRPDEAVISVGRDNKFGHPAKVVLERLEKVGAKIRRTDMEEEIVYSQI